MYIYDYSALFSKGSPQEYARHSSATQVSTLSSKYPTAALSISFSSREETGQMLLPIVSSGDAASTDEHLHLSGSP